MKRTLLSLAITLSLSCLPGLAATPQDLIQRSQAGDPAAERDLGQAYLEGHGVVQNVDAGVAWLERAAQQNDPYAAYLLGEHYESLPQTADNHNRMVQYYRQAAQLGHTTAQVKIANLLLLSTSASTLDEAARRQAREQGLALLEFAGKAGNGVANTTLADIYARGRYGVKVDLDKAAATYQRAAAENQIAAMVWLSDYYLNGANPSQHDAARGVHYLTQAATANVPGTAVELSKHYLAAGDTKQAQAWAQKAKERGDVGADAVLQQLASAATAPVAAPRPEPEHIAAAPSAKPVPEHLSVAPAPSATSQKDEAASIAAPAPVIAKPALVVTRSVADAPRTRMEPLQTEDRVENTSVEQRLDHMQQQLDWLLRQNTQLAYEVSRNEVNVAMLEHDRYRDLAAVDTRAHADHARQDAWRRTLPPKPAPKPAPHSLPVALLNDDTRGLRARTIPDLADDNAGPDESAQVKVDPVAIEPESLAVENLAVAPAPIASPVAVEPVPAEHVALTQVAAVEHAAPSTEPHAVLPVAHEAPPAPAKPAAEEHKVAAAAPVVATHPAQPASAPVALVVSTEKSVAKPIVLPARVVDHEADVANEKGVQAASRGAFEEAFNWFRQAAMAGNARALNNLAMAYFRGLGTPRNISEAVDYFERAVHAGDGGAAYNLGYIYQYGVGVVPDRVRAIGWYRQAASLGNSAASRMLSTLLSEASAVAEGEKS